MSGIRLATATRKSTPVQSTSELALLIRPGTMVEYWWATRAHRRMAASDGAARHGRRDAMTIAGTGSEVGNT